MAKSPSVWSGYVQATSALKQRIIAASFGEVGTGKTTFWLGAPSPIVIFSLDQGLEGVVEEYAGTKEIYVKEYDWNPSAEDAQAEAETLRDQFVTDYEHALQHARTVLVDKETDLWEVFRYAEFGAPTTAPKDFAPLNQRYRRLVNMAKATDINLGFVQGMKDKWESVVNAKSGREQGKPSGNRKRVGFSELDGLVHINIEHVRTGGEFRLRIGKARGPGGRDLQDQELPAQTFGEFAQLVFPESQASDWE